MIRDAEFCRLSCLAAPLFVVSLLAVAGCSGEPTAAANGAVAAAEQLFSADELNAMHQSVKTPREFRALLKIKAAERAGTAIVKTKKSAGKSKR